LMGLDRVMKNGRWSQSEARSLTFNPTTDKSNVLN
jgi:hypothetical protein